MSDSTFKPGRKYDFNNKEKGIHVSDEVHLFVIDKVWMPYHTLDRTMHKTVVPIQFNCGNKKAI